MRSGQKMRLGKRGWEPRPLTFDESYVSPARLWFLTKQFNIARPSSEEGPRWIPDPRVYFVKGVFEESPCCPRCYGYATARWSRHRPIWACVENCGWWHIVSRSDTRAIFAHARRVRTQKARVRLPRRKVA